MNEIRRHFCRLRSSSKSPIAFLMLWSFLRLSRKVPAVSALRGMDIPRKAPSIRSIFQPISADGSIRPLYRHTHGLPQVATTRNLVTRTSWTCLSTKPSSQTEDATIPVTSSIPESDDVSSNPSTDVNNNLHIQDLNPSQVEAVTQPLSSMTRVVAGPGSGKTRVLISRIVHLLQNDDARILAVTFTRKAANEMSQRLEQILKQQSQPNEDDERPSEGLQRVTLGTFHSICARILRWNGNLLATLPSVIRDQQSDMAPSLDRNFNIADELEQVRVLREAVSEMGIDLKGLGLQPKPILDAFEDIKLGRSPKKDESGPPSRTRRVAAQVFPLFRHKLISSNQLDFDDLILLTRELLTECPEVKMQLQQRWTHVLIDEFQDTSEAQLDLVQLWTSYSLFAVGDADQSIYSWRGAHVHSMSDLEKVFPNVQTVHLMENYRSTSNIVKAAQKVLASANTSNANSIRKDMKPVRGAGPSPKIMACRDGKAEANYVVTTLLEMINKGDYGPDKTAAFLYRTNRQSRDLEEACVAHNLPYVIRGGAGGFYKRAEVKDCLCFLRWLYNGHDQGSMLRAFKTPSRGIGGKAIEEFKVYCFQVWDHYETQCPKLGRPSPLDILISFSDEDSDTLEAGTPPPSLTKRALNRFLPFSSEMRQLRDKAYTLTVEKLLTAVIEDLKLASHFESIAKSKTELEERWGNVQELRQAAVRYSQDGPSLRGPESDDENEVTDSALGTFLDDIALFNDFEDEPDGSDQDEKNFVVNLMTIHAAKGMEFDAVFVVGNEEGTFPTMQAIQEGTDSVKFEEERRLCYVAMTRAKTNLFMTWRRTVSFFQNWAKRDFFDDDESAQSRQRSCFLDELVSKKTSNNGKQSPIGTSSQTLTPRAHQRVSKRRASTKSSNFEGTNSVYRTRTKAGAERGKPQQRRYLERRRTGDTIRKIRSGSSDDHRVTRARSGGTVKGYGTSTPYSRRAPTVGQSRAQPSQSQTKRKFRTRAYLQADRSEEDKAWLENLTGKNVRAKLGQTPPTRRYHSNAKTELTDEEDAWLDGLTGKRVQANLQQPTPSKRRDNAAVSSKADHTSNGSGARREKPRVKNVDANLNQPSSLSGSTVSMRGFSAKATPTQPVNGRKGAHYSGGKQDSDTGTRSSGKRKNRPGASAESPQPAAPTLDSTWFFPVGSKVIHKRHGCGLVLQPPPTTNDKELLVRVQFENGSTQEFPAKGSDLMPHF